MLVSILTLVFLYSFRENRIPVALSHLQPLLYGAYVDGSHDGGQGGRTWQPFVGGKNGHENLVKRVFTIFAANASFLRVITNLQI